MTNEMMEMLLNENYAPQFIECIPENGKHRVTVLKENGGEYKFKCEVYAPRKNMSKPVKDRDGRVKSYECWDDTQPPEAIIRPKAVKVWFREGKRVFPAYLPCYIQRDGTTLWQKFQTLVANQVEEVGMTFVQTLNYLTDHEVDVWVYENRKFKQKQVCYSEQDYLYWVGVELEEEKKEAAYQEARKKKLKNAVAITK